MRNLNQKEHPIVIAVDFDGTCVTHEYPLVGKNIGSQEVLKDLIKAGHQLVLFTMRDKKELQDAVDWFKENEIPLYGIQENPTQKNWTTSPKAYAQLYIDDAGINTPLKFNPEFSSRVFVDWESVRQILEQQGLLNKK